jgi:hypothetical protein
MKVQIENLEGARKGKEGRADVDLGSGFLSLIIVAGQGEFRLTEKDGRLEVHTSDGQLVLYPQVSNTLAVGICRFGE